MSSSEESSTVFYSAGSSIEDYKELTSSSDNKFFEDDSELNLLEPFQRFVITLSNQKQYYVTTPEHVLLNDYDELTPFERYEIVEFPHIYYYGENCIYKTQNLQRDCRYYKYELLDHILYRYEICSSIGKGAYGEVIHAYDHKNKEFVAIKIVSKRAAFYNGYKEVEMLKYIQRIKDPNSKRYFVQIRNYFEFRGFLFIVLEKLSTNLYELLKQTNFNGFGPDLTKEFTYSLVESVYILNKNSVVHCDLKPDNIVLQSQNGMSIKLVDFGLSCYYYQIYKQITIQTLNYCAPETILMGRITPAVDMWSVGCILSEFYTGRPLFKGEDDFDQFTRMMEVLGVPPIDFFNEIHPDTVRKYMHPNGIPAYCQYVEDGYGGVIVRPKRSRHGNCRVLPGRKNLRVILNNTEDNDMLDFIVRCLDWNSSTRMTAAGALQHPYLKKRHIHISDKKPFIKPTLVQCTEKQRRRNSEPFTEGRRENLKRFFTGPF